MQVVSLIQQKGGVGKTTIAVHLAHQLQQDYPSKRVAVADADPQQSARKWLMRGQQAGCDEISAVAVAQDGEGKSLRKELALIDADLVLVDLPPAIAAVSLRAALYANLMLVPVGASALDLEAARAAIEVCEEAVAIAPHKKYLLVPSKVQQSTAAGRELRSVLQKWGPVTRTSIGLRVAYADAATAGVCIGVHAPNTTAHQEIQSLAREVAESLGGF